MFKSKLEIFIWKYKKTRNNLGRFFFETEKKKIQLNKIAYKIGNLDVNFVL